MDHRPHPRHGGSHIAKNTVKALVIGLGISGTSASAFLEKKGYEVVGFDDKLAPKKIADLSDFSLVVVSPGVPMDHPLCERARMAGVPIKGEAQIALENLSQPCIGVTGTNGKTTVVKMLEHCLNACGRRARAVGNVGTPLTSSVGGEEILIVELSSYQLETLTAKVLDVGVILNIAEDHLDRYHSLSEYAKTKAHIQNCIKEDGELFVHCNIEKNLFTRRFQAYDGDNMQAVHLVCNFLGVDEKAFFQASSSFSKPAHRLEFVAEIGGVRYYNDSKATNVAAVVYALGTLQKKVLLLLGGQDKGLSFAPLEKHGDQIALIIAFGEAREKIANALQGYQVHQVETMQDAARVAMELAKGGDTVLFSPGCASFDAFQNFEERGEEFKRFVRRRT
ncbi:MAG: UDP-N-acetylmuramoylalanine--D-glutamate ligase [Chlamydiae bacterium]|nr:UDP-N-acetylmuramoylalanine--D-glutamate ligase [Chlamydiota bacterium]